MDERGKISLEEGPIPKPGSGELLVEVHASLISPGTEMGSVKTRRAKPTPPGTKCPFGYQNAGDVIAKGEKCDEFEVGTRVACMGRDCAFHTTYACVPKNLAVPIPDNVTYQEGAFTNLVGTALHAIRRAQLRICENVVVVGLGIVGQLCCQFAKLSGCYTMGLDRLPLRLKIAKELKADIVVNVEKDDPVDIAKRFTRGYGMDCGILSLGGEGSEAFNQVVQMMKTPPDKIKTGRVIIVGGCGISQELWTRFGNIDIRISSKTGAGYGDAQYQHGRDYPPVYVQWTTKRNLEEIFRLISEGQLNVKSLITHEYPLDKLNEACEILIESPGKALGVILRAK